MKVVVGSRKDSLDVALYRFSRRREGVEANDLWAGGVDVACDPENHISFAAESLESLVDPLDAEISMTCRAEAMCGGLREANGCKVSSSRGRRRRRRRSKLNISFEAQKRSASSSLRSISGGRYLRGNRKLYRVKTRRR